MATLLTTLLLAVSTFFAVFAGLTFRSTQSDAALFWKLERMANRPLQITPMALGEYTASLRSKTQDPDLLVYAQFEHQKALLLLSLDMDWTALEKDASVELVLLLRNLWRHPSGLIFAANVFAQNAASDVARSRCLTKFSKTDADRSNTAIAGSTAFVGVVLVQVYRRCRNTV